MPKIPDGILSVLFGKLAPVTGYRRNVENIFRSVSGINGKVMSERRAKRGQIKVCNDFMRAFPAKGFFNKTFPSPGDSRVGHNSAVKAILRQAIVGAHPRNRISYSRVLISKGSLPAAENTAAADNEEGNILFSWANNTGAGNANANDKVILVAYFPAAKQVIYSLDAAIRADGHALLETSAMRDHIAETWIGFVSNDEKDAANSRYTGTIYL